jgi:hypothetical protein
LFLAFLLPGLSSILIGKRMSAVGKDRVMVAAGLFFGAALLSLGVSVSNQEKTGNGDHEGEHGNICRDQPV